MKRIKTDDTKKLATYDSARAAQQALANTTGRDRGLEWLGEGAWGHWHAFALPNRENRTGHELRCEVVSPERIETTAKGHGYAR